MATSLSDQLALFNQYDGEYCSKATDVASKIQAIASLSGGVYMHQPLCQARPALLALLYGPKAQNDLTAELRRAKQREVQSDLEEAAQTVSPAL